MIEVGDIRIKRDGTWIEVLEIVEKYSPYHKRDVPTVRFQEFNNPTAPILERAYTTVDSYPPALED